MNAKQARREKRNLSLLPKPVPPRNPGDELEMNGTAFKSGGVVNGMEMMTRDWNKETKSDPSSITSAELDPSIIEAGLSSIRENAESIKNSKTISDIKFKNADKFFLIGAGGSLSDIPKHMLLEMSNFGTTITTNRGIKFFEKYEDCLDFAFFVDSKSYIFADEKWFHDFDKSQTQAIASVNTHPSALKGWAENYFFGFSFGRVNEWEKELHKLNIDRNRLTNLDSGLCSLSSQLHMISQINPKAEIYLLGHDFSYYKGLKYFDVEFKATEIEEKRIMSHPDFAFDIMPDKEGRFTITQEYLKRQAQIIAAQVKVLAEGGAKVYNLASGGILYFPEIIQSTLEEVLP